MLPTTKEIAWQIRIVHELYPKETISQLAARLMYSPVFVINALEEGEQRGWFTRDKGKDKLKNALKINYSDLDGDEVGQENKRLQNEILRVIVLANNDKDDVEDGTLHVWLRGIRPSDIEIALHILEQSEFIHKYEYVDPTDKKSKYHFYTLFIHKGKKWGSKQFKKKGARGDSK